MRSSVRAVAQVSFSATLYSTRGSASPLDAPTHRQDKARPPKCPQTHAREAMDNLRHSMWHIIESHLRRILVLRWAALQHFACMPRSKLGIPACLAFTEYIQLITQSTLYDFQCRESLVAVTVMCNADSHSVLASQIGDPHSPQLVLLIQIALRPHPRCQVTSPSKMSMILNRRDDSVYGNGRCELPFYESLRKTSIRPAGHDLRASAGIIIRARGSQLSHGVVEFIAALIRACRGKCTCPVRHQVPFQYLRLGSYSRVMQGSAFTCLISYCL